MTRTLSTLSLRHLALTLISVNFASLSWSLVAADAAEPLAPPAPTPSLVPTLSFDSAEPILAGGKPIDFGQHASTRSFDWDNDGLADLLVGGGDGRLWLLRNAARTGPARFEDAQPIQAGRRDRWGNSYTGLALADLVGNKLPDLLVCHSGNQISIHENTGQEKNVGQESTRVAARPVFADSAISVTVQDNCQGRFDVADWDGDGLLDLVTGSFHGDLVWYRNQGATGQGATGQGKKRPPRFGTGQPFQDIRLAYNAHPRVLDFNQDGLPDLLLGVNWGTVSLFVNNGTITKPTLLGGTQLQWARDGANLNIRELNGDDTTPELVDLDGDGVLDLVSGGKNGRLFQMRGIGFSSRVTSFRDLLNTHADTLGRRLRDDEAVRNAAFGALTALQADLASGLIPPAAREDLFQQLAPLARRFPTVLQRARFDLDAAPQLPLLAAQYWVVLLESLPDSPAHRQRVADALDFQGGHRRLLIDLGVLLIDNDTATPEHLARMHELMMAMPRGTWDVETITVAGWLGPAIKTERIRSRSGVNIFDLPLGRPENSFAADAPRPGVTDVYLICLAHELAHNMLDTVGRRLRPELYEAKFAGLAQAAGPLVVYQSPKSLGIDLTATKRNFQQAGAWDGDGATWRDAWVAYFKDKEQFDRAYCRGNIQFFLDAPQEAFATLANQYFADSQLMLEFCKVRWDAGYRANVNQFLLIVDYLSEGTNGVSFYVMRPGGALTVERVTLARDEQGRITQVTSRSSTARFAYQEGRLASDFRLEPHPAAGP